MKKERLGFAAGQAGRSAQEEEARALGTIPARRFGRPLGDVAAGLAL